MVENYTMLLVQAAMLAQAEDLPLIHQLDPPRNAAVAMALLGLVLLGITMVACIMIGGRWVRRIAQSGPRGASRIKQQLDTEWRKKLAEQVPDVPSDETMVAEQATDDTVTDLDRDAQGG